MDFKELHKKYYELLIENDKLKEEIKNLKARVSKVSSDCGWSNNPVLKQKETLADVFDNHPSKINKKSGPNEKIRLYMSLFKGRTDVYARRWENKSNGKAGYSPVCANEWKPGICQKPKMKCSNCKKKAYLPLNEQVIERHLKRAEESMMRIDNVNIAGELIKSIE